MKRACFCLVCLAICGLTPNATADDAFTVLPGGAGAVEYNPANLALDPIRHLELVGLSSAVGNNSYSLADYRRFNGAYWDEAEKQEILQKIDGEEFTLDGRAQVRLLGITMGPYALTTESRLASSMAMPKEAFELLLFGNTVGETFSLEGSAGSAIVFTELRLSGARLVGRTWSAGASLKYLEGWAYGELLEAEGGLTTTIDHITGGGQLRSNTAQRGRGYGLDLGVTRAIGRTWRAQLAVRDLFGHIRWSGGVEEQLTTFVVAGATLGGDDAEVVIVETETYPIQEVTTHLPAIYSAAIARQGVRWYSGAQMEIAAANAYGATTTPRCVGTLGYLPWDRLALYAQLGVGGKVGPSVGGAGTLLLGRFMLQGGIQSWGTFNPFGSRGVGFRAGLGLRL